MAEGGDVVSILNRFGEEYLNCGICHDWYNRPKILNCLHSFCEGCLVKYKPSQGPVKLSCPVCRQETVILEGGVKGLKTNFHLSGMVEAFRKPEKIFVSEKSASFIATEKRPSTPTPRSVLECRKHLGEKNWFYCQSCQELVCRVCTAKTHQQHEYHELYEAATACRESLHGFFPEIEDHLVVIEEALEIAGRVSGLVVSAAETSRQEVEERANAVIAKVMASRQRILDEINEAETETTKAMKERNKGLTTLRDRMKHSMTLSEHLSNSATDEDLLSLFPILQTDLKRLSMHQQTPTEVNLPKTSFMKLLPSEKPIDIDLGKLVVKTEMWELNRRVGKSGGDKEDFDGARGISVLDDGCIAVADLGMWTKGITMFTPDWVYNYSIKFASKPRDVASVNDCIVVADETDTVKVYNASGLAFQFTTTPSGTGSKLPVNIVSVAVKKNGIVVVGDVKRNVITEHRATDGKLLRTIQTNVPPYFLAVSDEEHVLLSGLDTGKVEEIDGEGNTVFTLTPCIEGDNLSCRGVCYNQDVGVYVVVQGKDSNYGHIHQYDSTGEFLGCVATGLYDPNGIALTSKGELAVADCFSVKIFRRV